jgi:hypothetical protein
MKKNNKGRSSAYSEAIEHAPLTSTKKNQGGENSSFPQEYEEQRSMDIRMKPQPFGQPKKSKDQKMAKRK